MQALPDKLCILLRLYTQKEMQQQIKTSHSNSKVGKISIVTRHIWSSNVWLQCVRDRTLSNLLKITDISQKKCELI